MSGFEFETGPKPEGDASEGKTYSEEAKALAMEWMASGGSLEFLVLSGEDPEGDQMALDNLLNVYRAAGATVTRVDIDTSDARHGATVSALEFFYGETVWGGDSYDVFGLDGVTKDEFCEFTVKDALERGSTPYLIAVPRDEAGKKLDTFEKLDDLLYPYRLNSYQ